MTADRIPPGPQPVTHTHRNTPEEDWPPPYARPAETRVVFPWYVVVSVDTPYGWYTPTVGVTDTEQASTTAMTLAVRARGVGCLGVIKRALHHMFGPDYTYLATVCTATVDPTTGLVIVERPRPGWPAGITAGVSGAGGEDR